MAIVKPKTKESEAYKTPDVPEDANRDLPKELEELFGESLPQQIEDEDVFDHLAKDKKDPEPEQTKEEVVESEPESEVQSDEQEQEQEELPEEEGEATEEVPESGDTDHETTEEISETTEEATEENLAEQLVSVQKANELLMAKINEGSYISAESEIAAPVETPSQVAQSQTQIPSRLVPVPNLQVSMDTITDEQFAEIQEDKDAFKSYIQNMFQQGVQSTHLQMNEAINQAMTVREQIGSFFKDDKNKDILPLHNKVKEEAYKLDASMPGASILEVLTKAGENVRTEYKPILDAMRIQKKEIIETKKEAAKEKGKPKVPQFAGTTGRREVAVTPKKMSAAEKDVLELFGEGTGAEEDSGKYVY